MDENEKLLPIDEETGEIDYSSINQCQHLTSLCEVETELAKMNTQNSKSVWILINNRFVCRLQVPEGISPQDTYFFMSEAYCHPACKCRISKDVVVEVFDMSDKSTFQGTIVFSHDKDLDIEHSAEICRNKDGKTISMYSVVGIELVREQVQQ